MSFIDDLQKATKMFASGAQSLATQQHVNDATEVMEKLKTKHMDVTTGKIANEKQYRKDVGDLAHMLKGNLTEAGVDTADIKNAFDAIAPQKFQTSAEALQAGDEFAAGVITSERTKSRKEAADIQEKSSEDLFWNTKGKLAAIQNSQQATAAANKMDALQPSGLIIKNKNIDYKTQEKNYGKYQEFNSEQAPLVDALLEINSLIDEAGTTGGWSPENRAKLQRLSAVSQLFSKDATYKLGVLNGADAEFLKRIMPDLGDIGALTTMSTTAKSKYKSELNSVLRRRERILGDLNYQTDSARATKRGMRRKGQVSDFGRDSVVSINIPQETGQPTRQPANIKKPKEARVPAAFKNKGAMKAATKFKQSLNLVNSKLAALKGQVRIESGKKNISTIKKLKKRQTQLSKKAESLKNKIEQLTGE